MKGVLVPADLRRVALLRTELLPWKGWFEAAGLDWEERYAAPFSTILACCSKLPRKDSALRCTRRIAAGWVESGTSFTAFRPARTRTLQLLPGRLALVGKTRCGGRLHRLVGAKHGLKGRRAPHCEARPARSQRSGITSGGMLKPITSDGLRP